MVRSLAKSSLSWLNDRTSWGRVRRRVLWLALIGIVFQATIPYLLSENCQLLRAGLSEAESSGTATSSMETHCSTAALHLKAPVIGQTDKATQHSHAGMFCGLCATVALFSSAVFDGIMFLPPPFTSSSSDLSSVNSSIERRQLAASFSARAPPFPI